mmetsp:Transcript_94567/g.229665  ORF Transcript_94567/g.229665 Transcript_94567/m.229665 type:complete len:282 (+) Transcript_94567:113-958(+)
MSSSTSTPAKTLVVSNHTTTTKRKRKRKQKKGMIGRRFKHTQRKSRCLHVAETAAAKAKEAAEWTARFKAEIDAVNRLTQGAVTTKGEARIFIRSVNSFLLNLITRDGGDVSELEARREESRNDAIKEACKINKWSLKRVTKVMDEYDANRANGLDVVEAVPDQRAALSAKRAREERTFRAFPKRRIIVNKGGEIVEELSYKPYEEIVEEAVTMRGQCSIQTIADIFDARMDIQTSKTTLRTFLHDKLGYSYDYADKTVRRLTPERLARIRRFFFEYADVH